MKKLFGLIGSDVVTHFSNAGWAVHGIDNNMRADFLGRAGDTRWNLQRLRQSHPRSNHHTLDIRERRGVSKIFAELRPDAVVHTAAQPRHDLAASRPFDDFRCECSRYPEHDRGICAPSSAKFASLGRAGVIASGYN